MTHNLFAISSNQPNFSGLKGIKTKHWHQQLSPNYAKYLLETKVIFGYKNPQDWLVKGRVNYPQKPQDIPDGPVAHNTPCNTKNCRHCLKFNTSDTITCYSIPVLKQDTSGLESSNLTLYCITCRQSKMYYISPTRKRLMNHFQGHFYNISIKNKVQSYLVSLFKANQNIREIPKDITPKLTR